MSFLSFFFLPIRFLYGIFHWINQKASGGMTLFIERIYIPTLRWSLNNKPVIVVGAICMLIFSYGFIRSGLTPFVGFPKLDSRSISGVVVFPDGTPKGFTEEAAKRMENAIKEVQEDYRQATGEDDAKFIDTIYRSIGEVSPEGPKGSTGGTSGGHVGSVQVELVAVAERNWTSQEIIDRWREKSGEIAGVEIAKFEAAQMGPGGKAIEFQLHAPKYMSEQLEKAVEECKSELRKYQGVIDVEDDSRPGKSELQIDIQESAKGMDVTLETVARAVRASYYGDEAKRIQRGRHEVKVMVRYPRERRKSMQDFENILIDKTPVTELANFGFSQGYSEINRVDQKRSITVSADVEIGTVSSEIVADFQNVFAKELLRKYPGLVINWEGETQQNDESFASLGKGVAIAILAMFVLLTLQFRTYMQPLIILAILPFGVIGAIVGHYIMGVELMLFSFFGLVALTGVIVNDSIVLVDFINSRYRGGMPLQEALIEAGRRRFRPVLLTSMTTIAGLFPILMEKSFQAQVLIPMATSLCFGLLVATTLILILVPVFYDIYIRILTLWGNKSDEVEFDTLPKERTIN